MSPGLYLSLRRISAGKSLLATACALVDLPIALRDASAREINRMADRLRAAEDDRAPLTGAQVQLLSEVMALDAGVYLQLRSAALLGLSHWHSICEGCGCTDAMACVDDDGPCGWATTHPFFCTVCDRPSKLSDVIANVRAAAQSVHPQPAALAL